MYMKEVRKKALSYLNGSESSIKNKLHYSNKKIKIEEGSEKKKQLALPPVELNNL